jgi:hypothetical protein
VVLVPATQQQLFSEVLMRPPASPVDPGADYGEVFTRRWVVDLILDLAGYRSEADLAELVIVEPSCGTGAFLVPIVERLIGSIRRLGRSPIDLASAIRAFDLLDANVVRARKAVEQCLVECDVAPVEAEALARGWVTTGDFLLHPHEPGSADLVVGNPPYIRLEHVPGPIMDAYRRACPTMRGRSDAYIGFFERGLALLKGSGTLGFICADRWMRNQYGADLRDLITASYAVETVVALHDVDAFDDAVSAYPAIVVLRNGRQGTATVVDTEGSFGADQARHLTGWLCSDEQPPEEGPQYRAARLDRWFAGRDLWPTGSPAQLALIADLEERFPPLQDARTRVGIGVATGCDNVFITADPEAVEPDRLLPLLRAGDTTSGAPQWSGGCLINPWGDDGLVDLARYPRLRRYFAEHEERLRQRYVARRRPEQWYRTIDRVDPGLSGRAKLVLPDMKAASHPVLDDGSFYPHHNLYHVTSSAWDLEVLGGLLLSDVANLFVGAYCVRMRGGCYRFQAQYLRRIRVPDPAAVPRQDRRSLAKAFSERDVERATVVSARLYGVAAEAFRRLELRS